MKKYLTPLGGTPTSPVDMGSLASSSSSHHSPHDVSSLALELDRGMFVKSTARPCIIVEVEEAYEWTALNQKPPITVVLVTGFDGKDMQEVLIPDEYKRVMPICPTKSLDGMAPSINTNPEWMSNPKHKTPSYILCIPIKVYPENLRRMEDTVGLDPENLKTLKSHLFSLGKISANADFFDHDEYDDHDDDICIEVNYDYSRPVRWDEIHSF